MSTSNRAAKISKTFKVLKKHYKPVQPPEDRSLLEHLLYACCLQNARHEVADEAFAKLQESYFDWNEIRVTTVAELAEVMSALPDPAAASGRLKRLLQAVFETHYTFDVDFLKKQNLGKAVEELEKLDNLTDFAIAYVTQAGLGGHAIPINEGALQSLYAVGVITESEKEQRKVPGIERAIPKSKGAEFSSLLQQLGADYYAAPSATRVRTILQEIDSDAKERLPKRAGKKESDAAAAKKKSTSRKTSAESSPAKKKTTSPKKAAKAKKSTAAPSSRKGTSEKKSTSSKKTSSKSLAKRKPR